MFNQLKDINKRPAPFEFYTAAELWTGEQSAKKMLELHLNQEIEAASRKGEFIERSVEWIIKQFQLGPRSSIADFGCGPGLYANRFAHRGIEVTGIDFSINSLNYARREAEKENLPVHYIHKNYLEFESEKRFDLIIMIFCDYCALSPEQRSKLLAIFSRHLKPGGRILFDVYTETYFHMKEEVTKYEYNGADNFWSPEENFVFLNTFKYNKEKVILDKNRVIEKSRVREVYNWLQYFDRKLLTGELKEAGFQVEGLYSDVAGTPYDPAGIEMAVAASKKLLHDPESAL